MPISFETIIDMYTQRNIQATEGHCSKKQVEYIMDLVVKRPEIKTVLEIGFNAGHSAFAFLAARGDIRVVSIDIGRYEYTLKGKALVDSIFGGRHTLMIGNSLLLMPQLLEMFPEFKPDLVFVDGGHDYPVPGSDIENALKMLKPGGLLLVDDVCRHMVDVSKAVFETLNSGKVKHIEYVEDTPLQAWMLLERLPSEYLKECLT